MAHTTPTRQLNEVRWWLYLLIGGAAAIALLAAYLFRAPNASAAPAATPISVTIWLQSSDGAGLSGGIASYYSGGWQTVGTTDDRGAVTANLLPGTYQFSMVYNGTSEHQTVTIAEPNLDNIWNIGPDASVIRYWRGSEVIPFQTVAVSVDLRNGRPLSGGVAAFYSTLDSTWQTIGTTGDSGRVTTQMLPGTYDFSMIYNGTGNLQYATIAQPKSNSPLSFLSLGQSQDTHQTVTFHAVTVTVQLRNNDVPLGGGVAAWYSTVDSAWQPIGTTGANGVTPESVQMLPGSYSFSVVYNGTGELQYVTIAAPNQPGDQDASQSVTFHAVAVYIQLQNGSTPLSGGVAAWYSTVDNAWQTIGTTGANGITTTSVLLLPGSYNFSVVYGGSGYHTYQTIVEPDPTTGDNSVQYVVFNITP